MRGNGGKYYCDAEVGPVPNQRGCLAKAVVAINSVYCELHYCRRHLSHAEDTTGQYFRRAAFAEPRQL